MTFAASFPVHFGADFIGASCLSRVQDTLHFFFSFFFQQSDTLTNKGWDSDMTRLQKDPMGISIYFFMCNFSNP